jgi:hypothetical protein
VQSGQWVFTTAWNAFVAIVKTGNFARLKMATDP